MRWNVLLTCTALALTVAHAEPETVQTTNQSHGIVADCVESVVQVNGQNVSVQRGKQCPDAGSTTVRSINQTGGITAGSIGTVTQVDTPSDPPDSAPVQKPKRHHKRK